MANGDNFTEYTVKIDAETKSAERNMQDLGDQTDETGGKFKSLRAQIRETTVELQKLEAEGKTTSKEFKELRSKLDDLNDAQERVNFRAGQFDDQLAALPGPLGQAGGAIKTLNESVNKFGIGLTAALGVVGIIVTAFIALKKSLESTAEGQATLTRVTDAFQKLLGPLLALLEKVAVPLFNGLAVVIEKAASAFAFFAEKLGISKSKIAEASSGIKDFKKNAEDLAKAQKEAADKKKAQDEKDAAEAKARREKAAAEQKKRLEAQKKLVEDANKILTEAYISTLDERDKEIYRRGVKLQEDLLALEKAGIKDRTSVLNAYRIDKEAIDKKYDEAEQKAKDEKTKKEWEDKDAWVAALQADAQKQEEEQKKKAEQDAKLRAEKMFAIDAEFQYNRALQQATFDDEVRVFNEKRELGRQDLEAQKANNATLEAYDKETAAIRIQIQKDQEQMKLGIISNALGAVIGLVGENTKAGKALAIAQATIDTYAGATKALATYPPPWSFIAAGTVVAAGLANVLKIINTPLPQPGGGTSTSGGGATPSITAPTIGQAAVPQMAQGVGANPSAQIAQTITQATQKPVKAYVVSQDITTQQQLDRKTNAAAVF